MVVHAKTSFLKLYLSRQGQRENAAFCLAQNWGSGKNEHKRAQILRRDGYLCQECRKYGRMTQATTVHHIQHVEDHPELAYNDDNLVSLCEKCHNKMHPEKGTKGLRGRYSNE